MRTFININGQLLPADNAAIPAGSRAFRYGYGLFETMLVQDGSARLAEHHWERLRDGMQALRIGAHAHFFPELREALRKTLVRNGHERLARARVQVWPASGGYYDGDAFNAQYLIETFPLDAEMLEFNQNGLVVGIAKGITKSGDAFSHIKHCNALPYALAARQAKEERWNDALLLNQHGRIADSTIANVFWMDGGGTIFTPPLSEGCVAGVVRRHLLSCLPAWGYTVAEQPATTAALEAANSIFLTNAIRGIRWVGALGDHALGRGAAADLHLKLLSSF